MSAIQAFAVVGVLGVGAQWLAWRFRLPSIVLMLGIGLLVGPTLGWLSPAEDIGDIYRPMIALAVGIILFEGGLTLDYRRLGDTRPAVQRLVYIGAPLGWVLCTLLLRFVMGLSWESSAVFGGVMVVTGPTVIAPMLRQAKLKQRPARVLQWEAIVNDPIGVLLAVLALEFVLAITTGATFASAMGSFGLGIAVAAVLGVAIGRLVVVAFRRGWVPEYMKVPVLFVLVVAAFVAADSVLHEAGLLAVTVMGLVIANADLASYVELHRFKEQATLLLVSAVFILLAASLSFSTLGQLSWQTAVFVALAILVARPLQVLVPLIGSRLPIRERLLVASTGPRGVVMVSVSGLFGDRLVEAGIADGELIAPVAFILVLTTVLVHGFALRPIARALDLTGGDRPGLLIVGGSPFATELAVALKKADCPVLIADPVRGHLASARQADIPTFYGDVLGEVAEHHVEFITYSAVLVASDNDAYNTLVATDLGPEFGREVIWQLTRAVDNRTRHTLPAQLGGRSLNGLPTFISVNEQMAEGWRVRTTKLSDEYDLEAWQADRPEAVALLVVTANGRLDFVEADTELSAAGGDRIIALVPPDLADEGAGNEQSLASEAADAADDARPKNEAEQRAD